MNCPRCHGLAHEMNKSLGWDWGNGEADVIIEYYCTGCGRRWEHWEGTCEIEEEEGARQSRTA